MQTPVKNKKNRIRPVFILPNLFTSASLFCGMCSIVASSQLNFKLACILILSSAVLDALDGPIARLTRSTSPFGLQYDSLADLVAFGVAPAFLIFHKLDQIEDAAVLTNWAPKMALGVCGLYVVSGAIRLARFNIQANDEEKLHFTGLPIPAAAGTVVSTYLVIEETLHNTFIYDTKQLHWMLLILMLILTYLMVSTTPFPNLKNLYRRTSQNINGLITAVFLIAGLVMFYEQLPLIVFVGFMSYLAFTLIGVLKSKRPFSRYSPGSQISIDDENP